MAMEQSETWLSGPRYLDMSLLDEWDFTTGRTQREEVAV